MLGDDDYGFVNCTAMRLVKGEVVTSWYGTIEPYLDPCGDIGYVFHDDSGWRYENDSPFAVAMEWHRNNLLWIVYGGRKELDDAEICQWTRTTRDFEKP